MNKLILFLAVICVAMSSCASNGNKADTSEAKEVKTQTSAKASSYSTVEEGSHVNWRASHLGGMQKRFGKVFIKNASVTANKGIVSKATILMDMGSLTVESFNEGAVEAGDLGDHLKSGDLFNIEKYPTSKFEMTSLKSIQGEYNSEVTANLTMLDATKSITFKANIAVKKDVIVIKSEDFSVDRRDWGLSYNVEGTEGVPVNYLIANSIGFTIDVKLTK